MTWEYHVAVETHGDTVWYRGKVWSPTLTAATNEVLGRFSSGHLVAVEVEQVES